MLRFGEKMSVGEREQTQKLKVLLIEFYTNQLAISKNRWLSTKFQVLKPWTKFRSMYSVTKTKMSLFCEYQINNIYHSSKTSFSVAIVKSTILTWKVQSANLKQQVTWSSKKVGRNCFLFATQLKFTKKLLRLDCRKKPPLFNYQWKGEITNNFKIIHSRIVCNLRYLFWFWVAHQICSSIS